MNKNTKKVLKYLNKHSSYENPVDILDISKDCHFEKVFTKELLEELITDKLIKTRKSGRATNQYTEIVTMYYSSNIGKSYFSSKRLKTFQEILKGFIHSIFCPIVVSIITTLITLLLVG